MAPTKPEVLRAACEHAVLASPIPAVARAGGSACTGASGIASSAASISLRDFQCWIEQHPYAEQKITPTGNNTRAAVQVVEETAKAVASFRINWFAVAASAGYQFMNFLDGVPSLSPVPAARSIPN
ncbi:hypothetical protein [Bradyrhizobium sp. USDA 3315]